MNDPSFAREFFFWLGVFAVAVCLTFIVARSVIHSTCPPADCRCIEHCPCQVEPAGE